MQRETLEQRMTAEVARKMFLEQNREPDMPKVPVLPSARQQELHNVTHQPFQPWCEACVLGRSRQSPHKAQQPEEQEVSDVSKPDPVIQIDYGYGFTKQKHEVQDGEEQATSEGRAGGNDQQADGEHEPNAPAAEAQPIDYRDQFGLTMFAAESTTGWITALPILEKGAGSLKRVTESLTRLSLQISPSEPITIQGDGRQAGPWGYKVVQSKTWAGYQHAAH